MIDEDERALAPSTRSWTIIVLAVAPQDLDDAVNHTRGGGREPRWQKALGIRV